MHTRQASRRAFLSYRGRNIRVAVVLGLALLLVSGAWFTGFSELAARLMVVSALTLVLVAIGMTVGDLSQRSPYASVETDVFRLIENDPAPGFFTDEDGSVLLRNKAAQQMVGRDADVTLDAPFRGHIANPSAALYRLQCQARLDGAAMEKIATRDGRLRLMVHWVSPDRYLWRVEDLPAVAVEEGRAENLPLAMITVASSGTVLFMNDSAREICGERVKTIDSLFVSLPVHPGEVNRITTPGGEISVVVSEATGLAGRRDLYFMPVPEDATPGPVSVFETLPVPMIKVAENGEILVANRLAASLIGMDLGKGVTLSHVMEGLGRPISDWLRETISGKAAQASEFLRLKREDREIFVQVSLSRVCENGEKLLIAVLNDATELKTLEAQFVQSQKMQAIGQLAGGVAHDFNNLLTAISGHCDLLLLRHDQGDQDYGDLVQINQNANRAAALVSQLLAFSRKQTLRPEVLDLRDTLSDLTHLLNRLVGEKVTLTLSHDTVLHSIRADKRQLEQVLMNLVVNARDAMPEGGEIRIETEVAVVATPITRDRATVPVGEYVTVKVIDEGCGISADKLPKVFEPFFTTKHTGEGTGLGLSTVYGIVKQTGGFIFVDSVVGKGSVFTLYFPVYELAEGAAVDTPQPAKPNVPQHGDGVVLLVEDEAPVRAFASRALRLRGYTVLEADCAEDALRTLEDPDLSVDIFVTDVVMPGMDGPTWVREALKSRPDVRVIFVSGYAEAAFDDSRPAVPNSVFLPKPFSLSQLTDTVHQQLS